VIEWATAELARRGKRVTGEPKIVHDRPWAKVARIPTDDGATFVKTMSPVLGHEIPVTALLARIAPSLVTALVAYDVDQRFMLMEDAGERLRAHLERDHDLRHWRGILPRYAELQLRTARRAGELVAAGAPDMRGAALPAKFEAVLATDELLTIAGPQSSTPDHLRRLRTLLPRVREWSDALTGTVPATIQHDDLHDGQIFFRDGQLRFLDWGDANVSCPLYSLVVLERSIAHTFKLEQGAPELVRLRADYLEPFSAVASADLIDAAVSLALVVGRLVRALTWLSLVRSLPPGNSEAEAVPGWFELFLEAGEAFERRAK
jgi:hypothetical protein